MEFLGDSLGSREIDATCAIDSIDLPPGLFTQTQRHSIVRLEPTDSWRVLGLRDVFRECVLPMTRNDSFSFSSDGNC